MWHSADLTIGAVKVRGEPSARPTLRSAVSGQLRAADFRPPGMPPAMVLIVRRLADPLPGRLCPRPGVPIVDRAWQRRARDRMAELYRDAACPAIGPVAPGARAVRFTDPAEMLAFLALDLSQGRQNSRWWWQTLLRDRAFTDLADLLIRRARELPAIVGALARRDRLATVAGDLEPAEAAHVLRALAEAHGLEAGHLPTPSSTAAAEPAPTSKPSPQPAPTPDAPWRPWLAAAAVPRLAPSSEALFGLALALHHEPSRVWSPSFVRATRKWWCKVDTETVAIPTPVDDRETPLEISPAADDQMAGRRAPSPAHPSSPAEDDAPRAARREATPTVPTPATASPQDSGPRPAEGRGSMPAPESDRHQHRPKAMTETSTTPRPTVEVTLDSPAPASQDAPSADLEPDSPTPRAGADRDAEALRLLEDGVDTRLGGVLYLINLMIHLDLPEAFEDDWRLASAVGSWGTLELLARTLLPDAAADDPLWNALRRLDGRPRGTLPGDGVRACRDSCIPAFWAEACDGPPASASAELLATIESLITAGLEPTLGRWLTLAMPWVRRRLEISLPADQPISEHFALDARLHVTVTHVDLVAGIDRISLPARLAGLDRDPGWAPQFGRVVRFHFD